MSFIRPFRGLRPIPGKAADVLSAPYEHCRETHRRALRRDCSPGYYAYQLEADSHTQTGLVFAASLQAYREKRIKRHELTRPHKETDHLGYLESLGAQTAPAMLVYPPAAHVDELLAEMTAVSPETVVRCPKGVTHRVWPIVDADGVERLTRAFDALPALYIADGHHRLAAADRAAQARRSRAPSDRASGAWEGFLAVAFPHHAMKIMNYNRVVSSLNGMSEDEFLDRVCDRFSTSVSQGPVLPTNSREFGLYLPGRWFRLKLLKECVSSEHPLARLDVNVLTEHLLKPILAIADLGDDRRIDFVGGNLGAAELERRVAAGMAAAFVLQAARMDDLIGVAERGEVMPPKSTWFEPKVADGLVSYLVE